MKFGHMNNNLKQQIFIDPNYLRNELDIRLNEEAPPHVGRQILLKLIDETIGTSNTEIRRQFEHDQSLGSDTIRSNALLSTTRAFTIGKEFALHGSTVIVSSSSK